MHVIEASQTVGQKRTVRVSELNDQLDLLTVSLKDQNIYTMSTYNMSSVKQGRTKSRK